MDFALGVGLALTALLLLVEHWFPWKRRPSDLVRYALGSGGVLVGLAVWLGYHGEWITLLRILSFYIVGGVAVIIAHVHDCARNAQQRLRTYERKSE